MSRARLALLAVLAAAAAPAPAAAYPWMISHEYTGCAACHADPSGGGLLTRYGRAQAELLLRTRYGTVPEGAEPGRVAGFVFGAFEPPESILLGGDVRLMVMRVQPSAGPATNQTILMQSDLSGQVSYKRLRLAGSAGYAGNGALAATVVGTTDRFISRTYWLGVDLGEENQWVVRAGRLNVPYGLRIIEHTAFVRTATRTDIDATQEHGLALAYTGTKLRGEAMAILGNYQVSPDQYRQRGYSAYLEWAARERLSVGASSLITHDEKDAQLRTPLWRQAHGVFGRYAPVRRLVLLAEADMLLWSQPPGTNTFGAAALLQADYELIRGLHVMATGELLDNAPGQGGASAGAWGSLVWFFAPHADVRADVVYQSLALGGGRAGATTVLGQVHLFL
ncbi:MAG TPA: hypothetical protein VGQ83_29030 [Polyangia bacterium]|jgi:hypothetical protein